MGQTNTITCKECGNNWTRPIGSGFSSALYYCNRWDKGKRLSDKRKKTLPFLNLIKSFLNIYPKKRK